MPIIKYVINLSFYILGIILGLIFVSRKPLIIAFGIAIAYYIIK